jgi:hypothetical protein
MKTDKLPKKDKYKKQYKEAAESRKKMKQIPGYDFSSFTDQRGASSSTTNVPASSSASVRSSSSYHQKPPSSQPAFSLATSSTTVNKGGGPLPPPPSPKLTSSLSSMSSTYGLIQKPTTATATATTGASSVHSDFSSLKGGGGGFHTGSSLSNLFDSNSVMTKKALETQRRAEECYAKYTFSLTNTFVKYVGDGGEEHEKSNEDHVLICPLNVVFKLDNFVNVSTKVNVRASQRDLPLFLFFIFHCLFFLFFTGCLDCVLITLF